MKSKLKLDLGLSFFALSMEYREVQLKEILFLINRNFSYGDILTMPVFVRRYYIDYITEKENNKK